MIQVYDGNGIEPNHLRRDALRAIYLRTNFRIMHGQHWVDRSYPDDRLIITAWNPYSTRIADAENDERDMRLFDYLCAGLGPKVPERCRGSAIINGVAWHEDGWSIPIGYDPVALMRTYEQDACIVLHHDRTRSVIWCTGEIERLTAT